MIENDKLMTSIHQLLKTAQEAVTNDAARVEIHMEGGTKFVIKPRAKISGLSDREFQVFELIGAGHSTKEIARRLGLTTNTAGAHQFNLRKAMGAATVADLRRIAVEYRNNRK